MNHVLESRPVDILLVEDNPGDVDLIKVALRRSRIANQVQVARDGVEALAMLRNEGPFVDRTPPDVILLDLNLPRKNGHEVLAAIKRDPHLKAIPVIVVTSSRSAEDVMKAHDLQANRYLTKPESPTQFRELIQTIVDVWSESVELPMASG